MPVKFKLSQDGFHRCFFILCIVVLSATAATKIFAACMSLPILEYRDSLLYLNLRDVLFLAAVYEIMVVCVLASSVEDQTKAMLIAITGAQFLLYRLIKSSMGDMSPCPCLGNISKSLGLTDAFTNNMLDTVSCCFLSGGLIVYARIQKNKNC